MSSHTQHPWKAHRPFKSSEGSPTAIYSEYLLAKDGLSIFWWLVCSPCTVCLLIPNSSSFSSHLLEKNEQVAKLLWWINFLLILPFSIFTLTALSTSYFLVAFFTVMCLQRPQEKWVSLKFCPLPHEVQDLLMFLLNL